jgi:hypothetical protein
MSRFYRDINIHQPDIKSVINGYGKHNRVIAFQPSFDDRHKEVVLYCRVDHVNSLRDPDINEILTVARKDQDAKGKFTLLESNGFDDGSNATEYFFKSC